MFCSNGMDILNFEKEYKWRAMLLNCIICTSIRYLQSVKWTSGGALLTYSTVCTPVLPTHMAFEPPCAALQGLTEPPENLEFLISYWSISTSWWFDWLKISYLADFFKLRSVCPAAVKFPLVYYFNHNLHVYVPVWLIFLVTLFFNIIYNFFTNMFSYTLQDIST